MSYAHDETARRGGQMRIDQSDGSFLCPSCGFPGLRESPRMPSGGGSYEICPSCRFEFGYTDDDLGYTYESWRVEWANEGCPWRGVDSAPSWWTPGKQP